MKLIRPFSVAAEALITCTGMCRSQVVTRGVVMTNAVRWRTEIGVCYTQKNCFLL